MISAPNTNFSFISLQRLSMQIGSEGKRRDLAIYKRLLGSGPHRCVRGDNLRAVMAADLNERAEMANYRCCYPQTATWNEPDARDNFSLCTAAARAGAIPLAASRGAKELEPPAPSRVNPKRIQNMRSPRECSIQLFLQMSKL